MNSFEKIPEKIENQSEKRQKFLIPGREISESFSRSSGKGGQNVNKVSTKVELRWNVDASVAFSEEEKEKIKKALANRINKGGDLIITAEEERSQLQNRQKAMEKLNKLVEEAIRPEKERVPTKPTRSSKERRLEEKKRQGERKKQRSKKIDESSFI